MTQKTYFYHCLVLVVHFPFFQMVLTTSFNMFARLDEQVVIWIFEIWEPTLSLTHSVSFQTKQAKPRQDKNHKTTLVCIWKTRISNLRALTVVQPTKLENIAFPSMTNFIKLKYKEVLPSSSSLVFTLSSTGTKHCTSF